MHRYRIHMEASGVVVVTLVGNIGIAESSKLREELMACVDAGHCTFRVDLSGVEAIDSSGLGLLVALQKRVVQRGGRVMLDGVSGPLRQRFEEADLSSLFSL